MSDPRIVPGAWVTTRFGDAVVVEVRPHDHYLVMHEPGPGHLDHPCEDDRRAGASVVYYRYQVLHSNTDRNIWVLYGDIMAGSGAATFLREADDVSAHVLTLTGPYGEGPVLPPRPPAVVPAGPQIRATLEEVEKIAFDLRVGGFEQRPITFNYDEGDAAVLDIFKEWDEWEEDVWRDRLSEVCWTVEDFDAAMEADLQAYIESLRKSADFSQE